MSEYQQIWREQYGKVYDETVRNPKRRAAAILKNHLRHGLIEQLPCEYGKCVDFDTVPYWFDFARPTDVMWLCRHHNRQLQYYVRRSVANQWELEPQAELVGIEPAVA